METGEHRVAFLFLKNPPLSPLIVQCPFPNHVARQSLSKVRPFLPLLPFPQFSLFPVRPNLTSALPRRVILTGPSDLILRQSFLSIYPPSFSGLSARMRRFYISRFHSSTRSAVEDLSSPRFIPLFGSTFPLFVLRWRQSRADLKRHGPAHFPLGFWPKLHCFRREARAQNPKRCTSGRDPRTARLPTCLRSSWE